MNRKQIRFTINGTVYYAVLRENPIAEKVAAMCPFEAQYTRSGSHEYYAALPQKAAAKGCHSTTKGRRNGLYYFEGWNALSLVFQDCDTAPYQIHQIGDFEEDLSFALEGMGDHIRILCELEEGS